MGPRRRASKGQSDADPPVVSSETACTNSNAVVVADDDDDDEAGCLHCHTTTTDVQVRCYECCRYICGQCHWCHEFQANHEIRVCDRCDAFYCRGCDEMDQCDDCGEVVCASCSTLLSCKFCGGGLCEECATACGRCGIVLCHRDAKFAVDCDTCRLSYCLVCLASGGKDPCVRCGHRPSKRMEQLVHLRLKSIYKAFKQSSNTGKQRRTKLQQPVISADNPEALLHAAASAAKDAKATPTKTTPEKKPPPAPAKKETNLKDEKEKADAAAAALLAELDEEEEQAKTKKKKKKKKKERLQAKRGDKKKDEEITEEEENDAPVSTKKKPPPSLSDRKEDEPVARKEASSPINMEQELPHTTESDSENPVPLVDPLEHHLCELVADSDADGLEALLLSIKGVPGRAALRKNAKKALKRIRAANDVKEEPVEEYTEVNRNGGEDPSNHSATPINSSDFNLSSNEFLKVISYNQGKSSSQGAVGHGRARPGNVTSRSECIMNMAPVIVGWVIGKGGQRIRDMMEESGARIWIDQESMATNEPRIVYVSGHRKSVETAVRMIKDLVNKAPTGAPQSRQTPPAAEPSSVVPAANTPLIPDAGTSAAAAASFDAPLKASSGVSMPSPLEAMQPRPTDVSSGEVCEAKHVMTCDARFVPLLIGRRGWTIKNIQDSSMARVDIDQSVLPRKITISGTKEHVQIAVSMVRDVLSYPQAQLQGAIAEGKDFHHDGPMSLDFLGAPDVLSSEHIGGTPQETLKQASDAPDPSRSSPPPSSLIMNSDAKSTISASSSLSSTPEPSMASTKGPYTQVAPANVFPPMLRPYSLSAASDFQGAGYNCGPAPQLGGIGPFPATLGPNGGTPPEHYFIPPASTSPFNQRPILPDGDQAVRMQPLPENSFRAQLPLFAASKGPGMFQQPQGQVIPPSGLRRRAPGMDERPTFSSNYQPRTDLWDQPSQSRPPYASPALPGLSQQKNEGFRLDAAVDFLHHSNHGAQEPVNTLFGGGSNVTGNTGVRHSIPEEMQGPNILATPVREESKMVDSLFGPAKPASHDTSLLSGLQGLSLSGPANDKGLWGVSEGANEGDPSPLLPNFMTEEQGRQHSRFAWGESS